MTKILDSNLPVEPKNLLLTPFCYSAEAPTTFATEVKEMKDDNGEIVDTQLFVVFKDAKLIEAVRYVYIW